MRWISDLRDRRSKDTIGEFEIELLLRGTPTISEDLADLEVFVASLSGQVERPADVGYMATALAATARASRRSPRPALRRIMALAASVAVLFALSGVAMAADGAVPGDLLYGVDRAMERIGIGDGGVDERIVEFDALIERGQHQDAFDMLDEFAESAAVSEASRAQRHIDLAATKSNVIAAAAQEKVAAKQQLIEDNSNDGVGNGRDFGQGVSDGAQPNDRRGRSGERVGNNATQGPPENAATGSDGTPPGQSEDKEPAKPDNADKANSSQRGDRTTGGNNSGGNAGGQSQNAPKDN
jgi:hypothetical protein